MDLEELTRRGTWVEQRLRFELGLVPRRRAIASTLGQRRLSETRFAELQFALSGAS